MSVAPRLDFRMRVAVEFAPPLPLEEGGPLRRRILHARSGSFEGRDMRGAVLAGGDWVLSRDDGSTELDIRFTLQTTANETIYMRSIGLFFASNAVLRRIRSGAEVPPHDYYFRTAILFETGAARLHDLNRRLHIGLGQRTGSGMLTYVFAVG